MTRVSAGGARLLKEWDNAIWWNDWLLVAAHLDRRTGYRESLGVVGFHPDGRRQQAVLKQLDRFGAHQLMAHHLVARPEPNPDVPRHQWDRRTRKVGVCFCQRYNNPVDVVLTDPLRVVKRLPHPDAVPQMHMAEQQAGDRIVDTLDHYVKYPANKWCTKRQSSDLAVAFNSAGKNGFVIFDRDSGSLRVIDLKEPIARVEIRPDGLVAAAILKDDAVAFVDLGDD